MKPRLLLIVVLSVSTLGHAAPSSKDIQRELEKHLLGKVMTIRGFYQDSSLTYNNDGALLSAGTPGYASSDGEIEIEKVQVSANQLTLSGTLPVLFYDPKTKLIRYTRGLDNRTIQVNLAAPLDSAESVSPLLFKVFYVPGETLGGCPVDEATRYQRTLDKFADVTDKQKALQLLTGVCGQGQEKLYRVGNGVKAPRPVYTPDPRYPEKARQKKMEGTVIMRVIVTPQGQPQSVIITRPLGEGFDEIAASTVRTWKFEPATLEGKPVPVIINIEVNFRLY